MDLENIACTAFSMAITNQLLLLAMFDSIPDGDPLLDALRDNFERIANSNDSLMLNQAAPEAVLIKIEQMSQLWRETLGRRAAGLSR